MEWLKPEQRSALKIPPVSFFAYTTNLFYFGRTRVVGEMCFVAQTVPYE
jgi:hypothetical protein